MLPMDCYDKCYGFALVSRESIGILTARQTEIVNCNWEGNASRAPPRVGLKYMRQLSGAERATYDN